MVDLFGYTTFYKIFKKFGGFYLLYCHLLLIVYILIHYNLSKTISVIFFYFMSWILGGLEIILFKNNLDMIKARNSGALIIFILMELLTRFFQVDDLFFNGSNIAFFFTGFLGSGAFTFCSYYMMHELFDDTK